MQVDFNDDSNPLGVTPSNKDAIKAAIKKHQEAAKKHIIDLSAMIASPDIASAPKAVVGPDGKLTYALNDLFMADVISAGIGIATEKLSTKKLEGEPSESAVGPDDEVALDVSILPKKTAEYVVVEIAAGPSTPEPAPTPAELAYVKGAFTAAVKDDFIVGYVQAKGKSGEYEAYAEPQEKSGPVEAATILKIALKLHDADIEPVDMYAIGFGLQATLRRNAATKPALPEMPLISCHASSVESSTTFKYVESVFRAAAKGRGLIGSVIVNGDPGMYYAQAGAKSPGSISAATMYMIRVALEDAGIEIVDLKVFSGNVLQMALRMKPAPSLVEILEANSMKVAVNDPAFMALIEKTVVDNQKLVATVFPPGVTVEVVDQDMKNVTNAQAISAQGMSNLQIALPPLTATGHPMKIDTGMLPSQFAIDAKDSKSFVIGDASASKITFHAGDGKPCAIIHPDGHVEIPSGIPIDSVTATFWKAVEAHNPMRAQVEKLTMLLAVKEADIEQLKKMLNQHGDALEAVLKAGVKKLQQEEDEKLMRAALAYRRVRFLNVADNTGEPDRPA